MVMAFAPAAVDVRLSDFRDRPPPTGPPRVIRPLPADTVISWLFATLPFTVELKVTALLLVVKTAFAWSVTGPP
jgi:hypothetical protein